MLRSRRHRSFKVLEDVLNKDVLIFLTPTAQDIVMNQLELARSGQYNVYRIVQESSDDTEDRTVVFEVINTKPFKYNDRKPWLLEEYSRKIRTVTVVKQNQWTNKTSLLLPFLEQVFYSLPTRSCC